MSIGDIYPVVITITVVAILLGIIFMVMTTWTDVTNTNIGTITNETSAAVSNETVGTDVVINASDCGFDNFAITEVWNITSKDLIGSGNYTIVSTSGGTWRLTDAGAVDPLNGSTMNVSYTFNYGGKDCEAIESIIDDFVDFIPWIGIILLVIAAAIVLGIVISSFASKGGRI